MSCEKAPTCCFTGPRPPRLPAGGDESSPEIAKLYKNILSAVLKAYDDGYRNFMSGMAEGFDLLAAKAVLEAKKSFPEIRLVAVFPCPEAKTNHSGEINREISGIIKNADYIGYMYERYTAGCELDRNLFMVNSSRRVIGYYNGASLGTAHCWNKAKAAGLETVNLWDERV